MPGLLMFLALGDGRYAKLLRTLARVDVLVFDDWTRAGQREYSVEAA